MRLELSSVEDEGPDFSRRVRGAQELVNKLEANNWNFDSAPEFFAERSRADVLGKEMVHIFDGQTMTRVGRLVMGGVGQLFNLMGALPSNSTFKIAHSSRLLDEIDRQLGTNGLRELTERNGLGNPEKVEYFNYTIFHQLREMVFWSVLYGSRAYPSTFEHMARHFAKGDFVHTMLYRSSRPESKDGKPTVMVGDYLTYHFRSTTVEWMDKPLFGGLAKETHHIEYLLTPEPTKISHPYLPLDGEAEIEYGHRRYHLRRFVGVTPKDALRGPNVPAEGPKRPKGRKG